MKELSAEEKADHYDRAKSIMEKYLKSGDAGVIAENTIKKAFPELKEKESEDERIKEDIITYLSTVDDKELIPYKTWISWIKKLGEQKPTVDIKVIIPKFHVGDIVRSKSQPMLKPRKIISIGKDCYWCEDRGCIGFAWEDDYEIVEQKPAEWSEEDEALLSWCISDIERAKYCKSQTKPKLCDEEIKWLKFLKDRVQPKTKQDWSEEDERIYKSITYSFAHNYPLTVQQQEFIKSLRSRSQWKPSDEQITWLYRAADDASKDSRMKQVLNELLSELKKLRND